MKFFNSLHLRYLGSELREACVRSLEWGYLELFE